MKCSEINRVLQSSQAFLARQQFRLPPWAAADGAAQTRDYQEGIDSRRLLVADYATRG